MSRILQDVFYPVLSVKLVVICRRVMGKRVSPDVRHQWFPAFLSENPVRWLTALWAKLQIQIICIVIELTSNQQLPLDTGQCSHEVDITCHLLV